jgi:hypothetical protein
MVQTLLIAGLGGAAHMVLHIWCRIQTREREVIAVLVKEKGCKAHAKLT